MKFRCYVESYHHGASECEWYKVVDGFAAVCDIIRKANLSEKIIRVLVKNASLAELQELRRLGMVPC